MNFYGSQEFWNQRYKKELIPYDWYLEYEDFRNYLIPILKKYDKPKILYIGCGTSLLGYHMYLEGYQNIYNIDCSEELINKLNERTDRPSTVKYKQCLCENLSFPDGLFDVIIDKGTLDSVMCSEQALEKSRKMIQEIYRCLKSNGIYLCLSTGYPEFRKCTFRISRFNWDFNFQAIRKPKFRKIEEKWAQKNENEIELLTNQFPKKEEEIEFYYLYICKKSGSFFNI